LFVLWGWAREAANRGAQEGIGTGERDIRVDDRGGTITEVMVNPRGDKKA